MAAKKFSIGWKASKRPSKQRKYRMNAPLHVKRKFLSTNLSKPLRRKYLRRNFYVRKGDTVKVLRGKFKGRTSKISSLDMHKLRVFLEGVQVSKRDGTKANVHFDPSNLQITDLALEDKKRIRSLERKLKK